MSAHEWVIALHWLAILAYAAGAVVLANAIIFAHPGRVRWATALVLAGLLPHAAGLAIRWGMQEHGPYLARFEVLSSDAFVALAFVAVFLYRRPAWAAVGLVAIPAGFLATAVGVFADPAVKELPPAFTSVWLLFHIGFAKLSAGAFLLSVGAAAALLLKRRGRRAWLDRVPSVEGLEAYVVRFVGFGFVFWTVTVIAGAIWANQAWGRYWGWDAIESWSLVTWLVYGAFLHARLLFKLKGPATAGLAVSCFAVFVLTALVLPYAIPSIHAAYFQ